MDETLSAIRKMTGYELILGLLAFMSLVGPGFLTIYLFKPDLVKELDIGKLLIFSISLNAPVICFVTFLLIALAPRGKLPTVRDGLVLGSLGAAISMHFGLLSSYIFTLNFRYYLAITAVVAIVVTFQIGSLLKNQLKAGDSK